MKTCCLFAFLAVSIIFADDVKHVDFAAIRSELRKNKKLFTSYKYKKWSSELIDSIEGKVIESFAYVDEIAVKKSVVSVELDIDSPGTGGVSDIFIKGIDPQGLSIAGTANRGDILYFQGRVKRVKLGVFQHLSVDIVDGKLLRVEAAGKDEDLKKEKASERPDPKAKVVGKGTTERKHLDFPEDGFDKRFVGSVVKVTDGDTLTVQLGSKAKRVVRIYGIDAPESRQGGGRDSGDALRKLVFEKRVLVRYKELDRYKRILGKIYTVDYYVNLVMVEEGWAWHYRKYAPDDDDLAGAEKRARTSRIGIWTKDAVAPWDWRAKQWKQAQGKRNPPRQSVKTHSQTKNSTTRESEKTHWLNTKSKVRHNPSCRYYRNTKSGRMCGPKEGRACKICGG